MYDLSIAMKSDVPRRKPLPEGSPVSQLTKNNFHTHNKTRNRSASSIVLPSNFYPILSQNSKLMNMQIHTYTSRRTPSNATFSSFTSGSNGYPYRQASEDLQRSSSRSSVPSRSVGYVALIRKQKATVWCDRAQLEDPRLQAQQKAAKIRATKEVSGDQAANRESTSGSGSLSSGNRVTAKIRHHGKTSVVGYNPGDLVGGVGGVPMRLSASEVEGGDSNDETDTPQSPISSRHRSGSGKSSIVSGRKGPIYHRQSITSSMSGKWTLSNAQKDEQKSSKESSPAIGSNPGVDTPQPNSNTTPKTNEASSEGAGEQADNLSELLSTGTGKFAHKSLLKSSSISRSQSYKRLDQLRRRGSVDDRAMPHTTVRLYIANPDVDSD